LAGCEGAAIRVRGIDEVEVPVFEVGEIGHQAPVDTMRIDDYLALGARMSAASTIEVSSTTGRAAKRLSESTGLSRPGWRLRQSPPPAPEAIAVLSSARDDFCPHHVFRPQNRGVVIQALPAAS